MYDLFVPCSVVTKINIKFRKAILKNKTHFLFKSTKRFLHKDIDCLLNSRFIKLFLLITLSTLGKTEKIFLSN